MEPASKIVEVLGGATKVARIAGVHRTRVYGWMKPREDGGTGGLIPYPHVPKLIAAAERQGVKLTGDDFIPGVDGHHTASPVDDPAPIQPPPEKSPAADATLQGDAA